MKKAILQRIMLITLSVLVLQNTYAQLPFGQVLSIHTQLKWVYGTPRWLLIVRDIQSGTVSPYVFDFYSDENHWLAFSYGRSYQITVSEVTFGPMAKINNFCNLENVNLTDTSLHITLKGILSPDRQSVFCKVRPYQNLHFTIVTHQ